MHINPYLIEQLTRQRRQEFIGQAARDCMAAQLPHTRRSLAAYILRKLSGLQAAVKRWSANGTQHEQPAPEV